MKTTSLKRSKKGNSSARGYALHSVLTISQCFDEGEAAGLAPADLLRQSA